MKKILVLLLLATTVLIAQPRRFNGHGGGPPMDREQFIERLNLTDEQEDQFKQMRSDFQKKNIELMATMKTQRLTLRDLFDNDKLDQDKIESQLSGISKIQNELKLNSTAFWFNVNKILKPEQQKIWKNHAQMMMKQRMQGAMKRGGMRNDCMPGSRQGMRQHRQNWGGNCEGFQDDDDVSQDDVDNQEEGW